MKNKFSLQTTKTRRVYHAKPIAHRVRIDQITALAVNIIWLCTNINAWQHAPKRLTKRKIPIALIVIRRVSPAMALRNHSASYVGRIALRWRESVLTAARTAITVIRSGKSAWPAQLVVPPVAAKNVYLARRTGS